MDRRTFIGRLTGSLLVAPLAAEAQQAARVWRIGVLIPASADANPQYRDAFVQVCATYLPIHGLHETTKRAIGTWLFFARSSAGEGMYEIHIVCHRLDHCSDLYGG